MVGGTGFQPIERCAIACLDRYGSSGLFQAVIGAGCFELAKHGPTEGRAPDRMPRSPERASQRRT